MGFKLSNSLLLGSDKSIRIQAVNPCPKQIPTMPRGQVKKTYFNRTPFLLIFLLIQFILIKIGQAPLLIVKSSWLIVKRIIRKRTKYQLPIIYYQLPIKRRRGRPRATPFFPFYLRKAKRAVSLSVPKKMQIAIILTAVSTIIYFYSTAVFSLGAELPSPKRLVSPIQPLTTEIYDRNNVLLYKIYEGRNRSLVKLGEVPRYLIQATLASEDKNFYKHIGVDFLAILRAAISNLRYGRQEGASTITQQLIKNTLLTPEKTYSRKIKEIILALWAERIYSKDQILQMYLNEAPYGGTAWGIDAASQTYFNKLPSELTLSQAAFLAGLPAAPTQFSPYGVNPALAKIRQRWVLDKMVEQGFIKKEQADLAYSEDLHINPPVNNIKAPHFVMYVKDLLSAKFGPRVVSQGGLKVYTSLDLSLQEEVEKIVSGEVSRLGPLNVTNGASLVTNPKTGEVLAMVGSKDYHHPVFGSFNVTTALRQPGSSIKVVTYSQAFKMGYSPGNTILDGPVSFKGNWANSYSPQNYDGKFHGSVSIRVALGSSYNIPAVKMLSTVGIPAFLETAGDLGITTFNTPQRYGLSLTLGGAEVKMTDMMVVYGVFANSGKRQALNPILKVTDANGNILEEAEANPKQVLPAGIAYFINSILSDNSARTPAFGPNSQLVIPGHTVAVKTGTSDNKKDNWTFGYTPEFVVGVWVGNSDGTPMDQALTSGVTGAAPIWNKVMTGLLAVKPSVGFARPAEIVEAQIDGRRDLAIAGSIPKGLVRVRTAADEHSSTGFKTIFSDAFSSYATPSAQAAVKDGATN